MTRRRHSHLSGTAIAWHFVGLIGFTTLILIWIWSVGAAR